MSTPCSVLAADESLSATAPIAHAWTLIEDDGPWGAKAVAEAGLDSSAEHTVLFARESSRAGGHRTWHADAHTFRVTDGEHTRDVAHPMLFVCTNGKRDTCCAVNGLAIVRALNSDRVLETTHLGGHRFAPTALLLPHNIILGRLTVEAAQRALSGVIPLEHYRGMSHMTRSEQAADIAVRKLHHITELAPLNVHTDHGVIHVSHRDGRSWDVLVDSVESIERPESCGAEPKKGLAFAATSVQPCTHDGTHR